MKEPANIVVDAPVHVGDIIIKNITGLKVDIVATINAERI